MNVYILTHSYEYGDNNEYEETKYLGVYSSEKSARKAIDFYFQLPGFSNFPKDCFFIGEYQLDKSAGWEEGFISWDEASKDD